MNDLDLFGQPVADDLPKLTKFGKKKRDETPKGYAAKPGSGPVGHFCRDCRHSVKKSLAKNYWKCALMFRFWTGGFKTDIRLKSPACKEWASKLQKEPEHVHTLMPIDSGNQTVNIAANEATTPQTKAQRERQADERAGVHDEGEAA